MKTRNMRSKVSPQQAAWLSEQPQKTVDKAIERGEVSIRGTNRELDAADVLYLAMRKDLGETLTAQGKKDLYVAIAKQAISLDRPRPRDTDLTVKLGGATVYVELKSAYSRVAERWNALQEAEREVVRDSSIRAGEPVIRGTRIPVYMIGDLAAQGADVTEILDDYPALNRPKLEAAMTYVQTHPRRGRPRSSWKERRKSARSRK